ncbi:MAG TPA: molybdate ABC transporter substrate-binding protein [Xanthobacteraceae bacterium]|jgi:molybdate transport system substrate-binding protein|nr:molybdate ABC transporter substrate-binding protein [Xanthobacteraceae bacterium]
MSVNGSELRVVSAEAVRDVLEGVAARFTKSNGCTFSFSFVTAGQVRRAVEAGEAISIAVASGPVIAELLKSGKVAVATDLGRIGLAIAIRDGAPALDISTPNKLKKTLLAAKSVSYTNPSAGGTAGLYFVELVKKMGIADEVNRRAVLSSGGRDAAQKVANGEAEFGITFPSEINPIKGAKVGGMLPDELQNYVTYSATIPPASKNAEAARAYLAALTAASARDLWHAAGFEPHGQN